MREILFRGFSPNEHGTKTITVNGEKRNGNILLLSFSHKDSKERYFKCKCLVCDREYICSYNNFKRAKGVGCKLCKNKQLKKNKTKHEQANTRLFNCWSRLKGRCLNHRNKDYQNYGGRGITVCDEWTGKEKGFENFMKWAMSNGYKDDLSIDRVDFNKGYSPDNCRWATSIQQNNNRRDNKRYSFNGKTDTLAGWCRALNLNYNMIKARLKKGYTFKAAIFTPKQLHKGKKLEIIGNKWEVEE